MIRRQLAALVLLLAPLPAWAQGRTCEQLSGLRFEDGEVTSAEPIAAGAFKPPGAPVAVRYDSGVPRYDYLPAFCRVTAALADDLKLEVWLPETWNGEFVPLSGGIYGGRIARYGDLAGALMTGAATALGNNGVDAAPVAAPGIGASNASYLGQHPQKIAGLSNAIHRTVVRAKAVIRARYGRGPDFTYMSERAARDPLLLIQQWPEDLDAVAVVGPIQNPSRHVVWQMWVHAATNGAPGRFIPPEKYPPLHAAVLKACDDADGVADGVLEHPPSCRFDPASLQCREADRTDCLTAPQVEAVRRIYSPVRDARTGQVVFPGLPRGGELEWFEMAGPRPYPFAEHFFRHLAFHDQAWDPKTRPVNFAGDVDLADAPANQGLNATNPDIRRFLARGGKLLLLAGWSDQRIPPGAAIGYYEAVLAASGARALDQVRLFVVPGMGHYPLAGDRASDYAIDITTMLKRWARTGRAPERFVATRYVNGREDRPRLVCAWPMVARYDGRGSPEDPAAFACARP